MEEDEGALGYKQLLKETFEEVELVDTEGVAKNGKLYVNFGGDSRFLSPEQFNGYMMLIRVVGGEYWGVSKVLDGLGCCSR